MANTVAIGVVESLKPVTIGVGDSFVNVANNPLGIFNLVFMVTINASSYFHKVF
jgi:hypothetical protein